MSYVEGISRDQVLLFPEAVDDYLTEENPVRFIDAFVEGLNLKGIRIQKQHSSTDRTTIQ